MAKVIYFNQMNKERSFADFIPYSSHITSNTIVTKEGDYLRMWKVGGLNHEGLDPATTQLRLDQLNTLFRSMGSAGVALWTHNVRRQVSDKLPAVFENDFCRNLDKKYYDSFAGYRMMANELYLTLIYRPIPSQMGKAFVKGLRRSIDDIKQDQRAAIAKLDEMTSHLASSLRLYDLEEMGTYSDEQGTLFSSMLELLNFLVSGVWQKVRVPRSPLNHYLGNAWIYAGTETIEIRTPTQTRYARAIDFKDYTAHTEPGLLNNLMYEDYEYVITQSFSFLSKSDGQRFLEKQHKQLSNTKDGSLTQIEELLEAIDQLIAGSFVMGEYHYSLMIFGDSMESVKENTHCAMTIIQDLGFLAASVCIATESAFYAQLPCNWFHRPRIAVLTSKNFAGLSSFHNFDTGKREGNPWGQAVTILKTPSGQPLYFNFHASKEEEDSYDQKLLGNTCIIGQSGAGKTVLLTFLLAQLQKFKNNSALGFTSIFFDKDRGSEIAIRAMGGKYFTIENGKPTGFNPLQMEPIEENILFLEQWVKKLVTTEHQSLSTLDELRISQAVRTVMRMPRELRRLSTVMQNMTEGSSKNEQENSIVKRLSRWCEVGAFGWVFDNRNDLLDFTTHHNYGFDGTAFLDNESIRIPIAMYLLHRMESIIDGRRFSYWMDEFWKWLLDIFFSEFAFNKQKTIRKQNGFGVFATQSPSDVLKSPIARAIIEQCATEIYLPNPKADFDEYVNGFKLTESEFQIIKSFHEDSRQFLIKQGHHCAIGKLDLGGFHEELSVLSGSTDNIELLDCILKTHGEDPAIWLPIFHEQCQARVQSKTVRRGSA